MKGALKARDGLLFELYLPLVQSSEDLRPLQGRRASLRSTLAPGYYISRRWRSKRVRLLPPCTSELNSR